MNEYKCSKCSFYFEGPEGMARPSCPECESDDGVQVSPCCGVEIDSDYKICPQCKEHC